MARQKKSNVQLELKKPIIFFDTETTGRFITKDKIVQIAVLKIFQDGTREAKSLLINPGIPIPEEATKIHGITDEMVKDRPLFSQYAKGILEFFEGCDIAGFNSNRFDIPLMSEEFARCGLNFPEPNAEFIDVSIIYHTKEPRTLAAGYKFYTGKDLKGAHDAQNDVNATVDIFLKQLEKYPDLKNIDDVVRFCNTDKRMDLAGKIRKNADGNAVYNFGKHKDKLVAEFPDYALWMLTGDFSINTKTVVEKILRGLGIEFPSNE